MPEDEFLTPFQESALTLRQMYESYCYAGFSRYQSLLLIAMQLVLQTRFPNDEEPGT